MTSPLISIIMPTYNALPYLEECLNSILNQSYTNWELLAVDDQSSDKSLAILRQYAAKDKRIKVQTNPDKGIIGALRLGYSQSQGSYITRMDADDKMMPLRLETMLTALQKAGSGHLSVGQVHYFSAAGIGEGYRSYQDWLNGLIATGSCFEEIYKECVIPSPCWMVSRADFEAAQAFSPSVYPEDYDLCFRFREAGLQVLPCTQVLHHWRDYGARTSRNDSNYADNRFLELKVDYFLKLDYDASRPLVVWGAGKKGKKVAQLLHLKSIPFSWVCNNPQKIGKHIYDIEIQPTSSIQKATVIPQILLLVAQKTEQHFIKEQVTAYGFEPHSSILLFC